MRFWMRLELRRRLDDDPPPAAPLSVFERYVRAEQWVTVLSIACEIGNCIEGATMRKLLLMLVLASSAAHSAERIDSLKNFTGIWAPAEGGAAPASVACKKELSI
jgi:hypothetical protein